jgi:FKBP-type peptidyl-prolyl cis-trans isomerase
VLCNLGWDLGGADMKIGGTRRFFIPSALDCGIRDSGAIIPPNADLIFDLQLLG